MSTSVVSKVGDTRRKIEITVAATTVDKAIQDAEFTVNELSKRPLSEKQLGTDPAQTRGNAILSRATRQVAEAAIREAVEAHGLRLASNPQTTIDKLVQCGADYSFCVEVEVVPELELQPFEQIVVRYSADLEVSDEEIDEHLEEIRGRCAQVEKDSTKPISENDVVELSFESFIDGKTYEGSSVQGYTYTLGSEVLPAEFENGLLGMKAGESKTIEFSVPEGFGNAEIEGRAARFEVSVSRVASCTLPELNDAFAQEFGYESLGFWRNKIRNEMQGQKEGQVEDIREKAARETLAALLSGQPDEAMVKASARRMLEAFKTDLKRQGVDFAEYCRYLNLNEEDVLGEMREEAVVLLRENLALESLFRKCDFTITAADLDTTVAQLAEESGMPTGVTFKEFNQEQQTAVREMTMHRMATEWLMENVIFEEE